MLLSYTLRRGANGLGIDCQGQTIVTIVPLGQAASDGVAKQDDRIISVDGIAMSKGKKLPDVLVPGRASYELLVRRPKPGALEAQARAAGLLGDGVVGSSPEAERPVRLVGVRVRRGPTGLGLDLGPFMRVKKLVPGSPAAEDASILPDDIVAGCDDQLVGTGSLPPLLAPGKNMYRFLIMRADAVVPPLENATAQAETAPTPKLQPRPLTDAELELVHEDGSEVTSDEDADDDEEEEEGTGGGSKSEASAAKPTWSFWPKKAEDKVKRDKPKEGGKKKKKKAEGKSCSFEEGGNSLICTLCGQQMPDPKKTEQGQKDDNEHEDEDEEDGPVVLALMGPKGPRRLAPDAIVEEEEEDDEEEEKEQDEETEKPASADAEAAAPVAVDVLWDIDSCPLPETRAVGSEATDNSATLIAQVQRLRLRLQTAFARGAPLGSFIVFGTFGSLTESALAQALVACGIQVIACGEPNECPRGGVAGALLSATLLRAVDHVRSKTRPSVKPLLIASARPEIQLVVQHLAARGSDVGLAAPDEALDKPLPAAHVHSLGSNTKPSSLQYFRWPSLYKYDGATAKKSAAAGVSHAALHVPRALPAWL
jgi:hypothetical protein